jgi:hypothetical protein
MWVLGLFQGTRCQRLPSAGILTQVRVPDGGLGGIGFAAHLDDRRVS